MNNRSMLDGGSNDLHCVIVARLHDGVECLQCSRRSTVIVATVPIALIVLVMTTMTRDVTELTRVTCDRERQIDISVAPI